jgi:hypothetical protein
VDATEGQVTATGNDSVVVKEDTGFLLIIEATTPDRDGSERLSQIVIDNVPSGWLPEGALPDTLFENGAGQVASATLSGGRLTITLTADVRAFSGALRVTPTGDEDPDGRVGRPLNITGLDLQHRDGSEGFDRAEIALTVETASDPFDPALVEFRVNDGNARDFVEITVTGALTLRFVPGVTDFEAAVLLQPALYEDHDVDRGPGDPFAADGTFCADDLVVTLNTVDTNSATFGRASASVAFDVDVDPVNNIATIPVIPLNVEDVVDASGGVAQIPLDPQIRDMDGSETITAVVLKDVPANLSIFAPDPANPGGPKDPVLLTEVNSPPGFNTWSLENGQWLDAEVRGVTLHGAGDFPIEIDVVTTEDDGDGTAVTTINTVFRIEPVVDGGDPSESVTVNEDTAIQVTMDGNLIDNSGNSPDSPEAILDPVSIRDVLPDSFGRYPRFFDGEPVPFAGSPGQFQNELELTIQLPGGPGTVTVTAAQASNLWVLPGQDSHEDISFEIEVAYFEPLDTTEATIGVGRVTLNVVGVADAPVVDGQDAGSFPTPGLIDDTVFRPDEVVDGVANAARVYGYAGFDNAPFLLDSRLLD